jgi:hypothetical protein
MASRLTKSRWRCIADDLATAVAGHQEPLTFVLGAGCSMSSGAPATPVVEQRLVTRSEGRIGPGRLRTDFQDLRAAEVNRHLEDLFAGATPNFGYRLLAGLARRRRVYVINLCWDPLLDQACELVKVTRVSYDPEAGSTWAAVCERLPADAGLVNCHVHGQLGGVPRFGTFQTSTFHPETKQHVAQMLRHETVIIGASLADFDLVESLEALDQLALTEAAPNRWVLARDELVGPRRASKDAFVAVSRGVDFDDVLQAVAEQDAAAQGIKEASWDQLRAARPQLDLPASLELARLEPSVVRGLLDANVVALLGSGFSAKTVTAWRIGHLRRLLAGGGPTLAGLGDLEAIVSEMAMAGVERESKVLVLNDPFGPVEFEANPRVRDLVEQVATSDSGVTVLIASRLTLWRKGAARVLEQTPGTAVPSVQPQDWFATEDLLALARRLGAHIPVLKMVEDRDIKTPAMLVASLDGRIDPNSEHRRRDLLGLLEASQELALLCGLVALQEFMTRPLRLQELAVVVNNPTGVADVGAFLRFFELGTQTQVAFWHHDMAEATDQWLANVGLAQVAALAVLGVAEAADGWRQRHRAAKPNPEWAGVFMRRNSRPDDLQKLVGLNYDRWNLADVAAETVRLWPELHMQEAGRQLLKRLMADRKNFGTYALLEACLYMGVKADDELWHQVGASLAELSTQKAYRFETDLAVDALCWRLPPGSASLKSWAQRYLLSLHPAESSWTLVRFLAGYHPGGFAEFAPPRVLRTDSTSQWRARHVRYAAKLCGWHFAHQARARVQLSQDPHIDKSWLCRGTNPDAEGDSFRDARLRLLSSLTEHPAGAGWAFQVGCAQRSMSVLPTDSESDEVLREALAAAPSADAGVMSAVLTYESAAHFQREIRHRLDQDPAERQQLLAAMHQGLSFNGLKLCPPRFQFARDGGSLHRMLGMNWGRLQVIELPVDPDLLTDRLREAYVAAEPSYSVRQKRAAVQILVETQTGDFSAVNQIAAREGATPSIAQVLAEAVELRAPSLKQEKLI